MIRLLAGDCRDVLATLPAESVHCVVTSPPYFGLRDYGTAQWAGGDAGCDHVKTAWQAQTFDSPHGGTGRNCQGWKGGERNQSEQFRDTCGKCGATRIDRQIGLEATPDAYLATMVQVFREIRRVLRSDGTVWMNVGDAYAHGKPGGGSVFDNGRTDGRQAYEGDKARGREKISTLSAEYKPKDLMLMPARLALALQADGWWVRSDIIWHKPNPMPESCTDRPTSAHEHVFLLTKSGASTFWTHRDHAGSRTPPPPDYRWVHTKSGEERDTVPSGWDEDEATRKLWRRINLWRGHDYFYDADAVREPAEYGYQHGRTGFISGSANGDGHRTGQSGSATRNPETGRSCRNVWTIATQAFPSAHFATYPVALAERCIRAGTSERGCCAACGAPWVRVTERQFQPQGDVSLERGIKGAAGQKPMDASNGWDGVPRGTTTAATTGWAPSCTHGGDPVPATVLDPFAGAGTTLLVADRLQRDAIGIELNPAYTEMAMARCVADAPLFTSWPPAEPPEEQRQADLFREAAD